MPSLQRTRSSAQEAYMEKIHPQVMSAPESVLVSRFPEHTAGYRFGCHQLCSGLWFPGQTAGQTWLVRTISPTYHIHCHVYSHQTSEYTVHICSLFHLRVKRDSLGNYPSLESNTQWDQPEHIKPWFSLLVSWLFTLPCSVVYVFLVLPINWWWLIAQTVLFLGFYLFIRTPLWMSVYPFSKCN